MAVRNFWIEADIDGRRTELHGGPVRKDGGFDLRIYVRDNGSSKLALVIEGYEIDGNLRLNVWPKIEKLTSENPIQIETKR